MLKTGLSVLIETRLSELKNARIGIVANHASVTPDLAHISDALSDAGVNIKALFGPEHGARGDVGDGLEVGDYTDPRLGVPVYSLYGKHKAPTSQMLDGIDIMLVDLQDVGSRFYTFLYTMSAVMDACAKRRIPAWILDRPNPISGLNPDGPVLDSGYSSFVGMYPIAQRHAMTVGELARYFHSEFGVGEKPEVIQMQGWSRNEWFDQTGLPWVMPSPGMPTLDTATLYPGTCLFEGTNVSEGRGTTRPFEVFGAPWIDPINLHKTMVSYNLPGVKYREAYFIPTWSKHTKTRCAGLQIYVTDRDIYRPVVTGIAAICAIKKLHQNEFAFLPPNPEGRHFFDLLTGSSHVREAIESGNSPWDIAQSWHDELKTFCNSSTECLLY